MLHNNNHNLGNLVAHAIYGGKIASASTLKFLDSKETSTRGEMIATLKSSLQSDLYHFSHIEYFSTRTAILAEAIASLEEERDALVAETRLIHKNIAIAEENVIEAMEARMEAIMQRLPKISKDIKKYREEEDILFNWFDFTYSDSMDLFQTATASLVEDITGNEDLLEACDNISGDMFVEVDGKTTSAFFAMTDSVIVAEEAYKTKAGIRAYNLIQNANKAVRGVINSNRSGIASKTVNLITGEDEDGNETYIQATALQTLGGIDSIDRAEEFRAFYDSLNLTETEDIMVRYLMQGKTQSDIAKRLRVSQQAISLRINALRKKIEASENEVVVAWLKRYKANTKK